MVEGNVEQHHARDTGGIGGGGDAGGDGGARPRQTTDADAAGARPNNASTTGDGGGGRGDDKKKDVSFAFEERFREQFEGGERPEGEDDDKEVLFQPPPFKRQRSNSDSSLQVGLTGRGLERWGVGLGRVNIGIDIGGLAASRPRPLAHAS